MKTVGTIGQSRVRSNHQISTNIAGSKTEPARTPKSVDQPQIAQDNLKQHENIGQQAKNETSIQANLNNASLNQQLGNHDAGRARSNAQGASMLTAPNTGVISRGNDKLAVHGQEYSITTRFSAGAMGAVYKMSPESQANDPLVFKTALNGSEANELMTREAQAHKQAGDHPNIAKFTGATEINGQKGFVMEHVGGGNLKDANAELQSMYRSGSISHSEYWGAQQYLMRGTMNGLRHAESNGVVHHDIKPENILLDPKTMQPKIADFGVATVGGKAPWLGGTAGYLAPEVAKQMVKPTDVKSASTGKADVYSVGSMAYQVGAGKDRAYSPGHNPQAIVSHYESNPNDTPIKPLNADEVKKGRAYMPGHQAAQTQYTDFVNKTMAGDPAKRLSGQQALNHPFLKDRLCTDEQAQGVLRKMLNQRNGIAEQPKQTPVQGWQNGIAPEKRDHKNAAMNELLTNAPQLQKPAAMNDRSRAANHGRPQGEWKPGKKDGLNFN